MPSRVKPTIATPGISQAQQQIEPVLGRRVAKRTRACENGELYVEPGWAGVGAWLIDAAVIALAATVAAGGLYAARTAGPLVDDATRRSAQIEALAAGIGVLVVAPLIYGLFYASGRVLGGWLTGTRLIRLRDSGRIGFPASCWAMFARTLGIGVLVISALLAEAGAVDVSFGRVSRSESDTARLRAAGFSRLPDRSP